MVFFYNKNNQFINIFLYSAAADCRAVKHCIQTVWIHKNLPPDNSEVCQTCLDMVKQARDQLLSNDTQVIKSLGNFRGRLLIDDNFNYVIKRVLFINQQNKV